jgi:hypothetical protein
MLRKVSIVLLSRQQTLVSQFVEERPKLLSIPYQLEDVTLSYHPSTVYTAVTKAHSVGEILPRCQVYSFPAGMPFLPDKVELGQGTKSGDQSDSVRLCVLDKSRLHYKLFTIPNHDPGQDTIDDDVSMT